MHYKASGARRHASEITPYDALKLALQDIGRPVKDALAMSPGRDPFYCGQPAQLRDAQWFAELHSALDIGANVHLRRIHYRLVSQSEPPIKPDGTPYSNTKQDWQWFCEAVVAARTLALVDVRTFVDRRNPDPLLLRTAQEQIPRGYSVPMPDFWFAGIFADLDTPRLDIPSPEVRGFSYTDDDQPYLIEVWVEKTTMNDVLVPVCKRYRANLITAAGFQSITAAVNLIDRAQRLNKPARIFYISDFDPAGDKMPIAVARQVEFWLRQYDLDIDLALTPIALTAEQVAHYELPRIPIKATDNRRAKFEARYGEGAVELDALEALYPGELARILDEAIAPYWDRHLRHRINAQAEDIKDRLSLAWSNRTSKEQAAVAEIQDAIEAIFSDYQDELSDLAERLDTELQPLRDQLDVIENRIDAKRDDFEPEIPERLTSDKEPPDESEWMFSSRRGYFEQLTHYRKEAV